MQALKTYDAPNTTTSMRPQRNLSMTRQDDEQLLYNKAAGTAFTYLVLLCTPHMFCATAVLAHSSPQVPCTVCTCTVCTAAGILAVRTAWNYETADCCRATY